ncbi:hypothetical protein AB0F88_10990 [Streptosporangium sp. NPDC023963]|uniref:DUF7715 family protein n=1 Tax=Streptosporangium sp. NPDC023963 TaxID=3155608 RepID=UPI003413DFF4
MRVLTATDAEDPRDGGFNRAIPGELLFRPFVCSTGDHGACGCERSWAGVGSEKGTTLAAITDRTDLDLHRYVDLVATYLVDKQQWNRDTAEDEARLLADLAADFADTFGEDVHLTIEVNDTDAVFSPLRVEHG